MLAKRFFACFSLAAALGACAPTLPENTDFTEARWLDQNWSPDARHWFHHTSQGTSTLPIPYDWFVALEQPRLWLSGEPPLLKDSAYLRRFGFIPSPKSFDLDSAMLASYGYSAQDKADYARRAFAYDEVKFGGNDDELPVGFARLTNAMDPVSGAKLPDQIGFTCAACHTGQLEYDGVSLRIDGAPAVTNLGKFREALGLAVVYTKIVPFRFGRFADRVLGKDHTPEQEAALEAAFDTLVERLKAIKEITDPVFEQNVEEGFTRLDALTRIGNEVFFHDLYVPGADNRLVIENLEPVTAPVNFPQLWDSPWFLWVQYDASIMQPMVRNAGEALGVRAKVNLVKDDGTLYRSTVEVREVYDLEQLLAGDYPFDDPGEPRFTGLRSPKWPEDLLGEIDQEKAARGRHLYQEHCQECHLPVVGDPAFWSGKHWAQLGGQGLQIPQPYRKAGRRDRHRPGPGGDHGKAPGQGAGPSRDRSGHPLWRTAERRGHRNHLRPSLGRGRREDREPLVRRARHLPGRARAHERRPAQLHRRRRQVQGPPTRWNLGDRALSAQRRRA